MTDLTLLDRAHSRISPSSFARAEACTASVHLSADALTVASGTDALAGTAAHQLAETCLRGGLDVFELGPVDTVSVRDDGGFVTVPVDAAMLDNVQIYLDAVREAVAGRPFHVEQQIHLGFAEAYLGEPIWGHADVLVREYPFVVVDYKNGYHPVPADSIQLGLYLLMVALEHDPALEAGLDASATIAGRAMAGTTIVVQPNAPGEPVRQHEWTWEALRELRDRVIRTLRRIKRKDWTYQDGEWCRFCPAAGFCPQLAAVARDAAMATVLPTPEMVATGEITADTLADWLDVVDRLDVWAKRVQEVALDYARHGGVLRNRKAVAKRTTRRWVSDDDAATKLEALGVDPWQRKIVTPAEAERRLPPARRGDLPPTEKPDGELTLAPLTDPRPSINVGLTLKAALASSVALGYSESARKRTAELLKS